MLSFFLASPSAFAAKADNIQAAGTYQLEIAFNAIANPLPEPTGIPGEIRYDANSGTVIGQMGTQSAADGNYYNWYSATAGNGKYSTTSANASGDICPNGWHLPTGNASGDYAALDVALGGNGINSDSNTSPTGSAMSMLYRTFPNNFVYSGFLFGSSGSRNTTAAYWSSTASNNNGHAAYLYVTNAYARPGRSTYQKYSGWTVRCIFGAN